jgi:hypothetical protein
MKDLPDLVAEAAKKSPAKKAAKKKASKKKAAIKAKAPVPRGRG